MTPGRHHAASLAYLPGGHPVTRDTVTETDRNICVGFCHHVTCHQPRPPPSTAGTHRKRRTATTHAAGPSLIQPGETT